MTYRKGRKKTADSDNENDEAVDQAVEELSKLAGDVDFEGDLMANDEGEDDNVEGWVDEREEMTEDELRELSASVAPVRLLLTKVIF